jgi:hypothetical protein
MSPSYTYLSSTARQVFGKQVKGISISIFVFPVIIEIPNILNSVYSRLDIQSRLDILYIQRKAPYDGYTLTV